MKLIVRPIPDISPPVIDSRSAVIRDPRPFIQGTLAVDVNRGYDTL